jgi:hypothetical protein
MNVIVIYLQRLTKKNKMFGAAQAFIFLLNHGAGEHHSALLLHDAEMNIVTKEILHQPPAPIMHDPLKAVPILYP